MAFVLTLLGKSPACTHFSAGTLFKLEKVGGTGGLQLCGILPVGPQPLFALYPILICC